VNVEEFVIVGQRNQVERSLHHVVGVDREKQRKLRAVLRKRMMMKRVRMFYV